MDILKPWVFDDHVTTFITFVENEFVICGCAQWVTDAKSYVQRYIKDQKPFEALWGVTTTTIKAYLTNIPTVTFWAFMQWVTTMTFNFYYLGYALGKLETVFLKDALSN